MWNRCCKLFLLILCLPGFSHAQAEITPLVIGETLEFESDVLNEKRLLNIYLPEGYHPDSTATYPVVYLLDGSIDEDFLHISGIVQFGSFSWIEMIPKSIVVGIANVDRQRDFTYPSTLEIDRQDFPTSGGSAKFIAFIKDELRPLINSTYNTTSEATLIGQSLGGLLATEILLKHPQTFDNYVIVSPSLWWDNENLLKVKADLSSSPNYIYVAVGKEHEVMQRTARELYEKIDSAGYEQTETAFEFFEQCDHGDVLHLAVYSAFAQMRMD